jgi:hypothetical protein
LAADLLGLLGQLVAMIGGAGVLAAELFADAFQLPRDFRVEPIELLPLRGGELADAAALFGDRARGLVRLVGSPICVRVTLVHGSRFRRVPTVCPCRAESRRTPRAVSRLPKRCDWFLYSYTP